VWRGAINTAVDLIVAHFGTSRDPEVKAKLGNSSVSPNVGHLILKYLCPAVQEVLQDGLRAHVLDIIIGQRRNWPWSVVEASTQLGPSTRVLHSLFLKVSQYSELTNHSMRLNAFIFGLLNLRSLEFWFNHIYTHEDIIAAHYHPWGFLPLSQGACQPMFEELLLLLQPLSLLPFDLDLLFEPHQLQKGQEHMRRKKQLCSARQDLDQSARSTFQLMRSKGTLGVKDKSADRMKGVGEEDGERERKIERDGQREREKKRERDGDAARLRSKQSGWWFQLMQSSQVYIDNSTQGSKFVKWEKRKKGGTEGWRQNHPPPREGVVEGAEANHTTDEHGNGGGRSRISKGKPSWMGSPPESVLSELKRSKEQQPDGQGPEEGAQTRTGAGADGVAHGLHWGRLFGAGNLGRTEKTDQKPGARSQKGRMPSGWLNLDRAMLDLVVQSVGAGKVVGKGAEPPKQTTHSPEAQQSPTHEVRALCHHIATETGHLSFHKGDVLQVLGRADSDWLLCALGDAQGLVPIIYVTLNGKERQGPHSENK
uniref:RUN and SH3 domain containing 2 n=1 Tax=Electrophorus electricus TaxID=8005 RepID=A0A4W4G8Z0_ELEEL